MALNYTTYFAIPKLETYTEAKRWHDEVKPIRGDEHKTRPCGRRDQKWFSIWEHANTVHVGYGSGELSSRTPLVSFHKSGMISIPRKSAYTSASDNERISRILGTEVKTHQYLMWIKCAWFDGPTKGHGYLPLHHNGARYWNSDVPPGVSNFVRDADSNELVYVNYSYPVTRKINRAAMKEVREPYRPFIDYVNRMCKLQGGRLQFSNETKIELFGTYHNSYNGRDYPNSPPDLRYGDNAAANWEDVLGWMRDSDQTEWLRAAVTMAYYGGAHTPLSFFDNHLMKKHRDTVFNAEVHKEGRFVRDRYASLFLYQ